MEKWGGTCTWDQGEGEMGNVRGRDGAESVEIDAGRSIGARYRESKAGRRRRREAKAPPVTGALTCLLVVLGILHRLRVGDAFKPAVLALDQERCWEHTGGAQTSVEWPTQL